MLLRASGFGRLFFGRDIGFMSYQCIFLKYRLLLEHFQQQTVI